MLLAADSTFAGKYQIQRILGQGGMGTVYLARHLLLDRLVALKVLRSDIAPNSQARKRLIREGRALASLRGKHIARVLDVEAPDGGDCFLVLEYLEGEHLGELLQRIGPLPIGEAVGYVLEVCDALTEAHAAGIVHRDIKPSNLFVTTLEDGALGIKVIDFGISKSDEVLDTTTQTGTVLGSPLYMAPEQMRASGIVDARCDIWALGAVLYELLVGRPPHSGNNVLEICASILESPPQSPRAVRADVPSWLDWVVRSCMARNPERRFGSSKELAQAIRHHSASFTARPARAEARIPFKSQPKPQEPNARPVHRLLETADEGLVGPRPSAAWNQRSKWIAAALLALGIPSGVLLLGRWQYRPEPNPAPSNRADLPNSVPTEDVTLLVVNAPPLGGAAAKPTVQSQVEESSRSGRKGIVRPSALPRQPNSPLSRIASSRSSALPSRAENSAVPPSGGTEDPVLQYGRF